jgi:hypothetical protein
LDENRKVSMEVGEGNPFFGRMAEEYASEVLEKAKQADAVSALGGDPSLLAPHAVVMRKETARTHIFNGNILVT